MTSYEAQVDYYTKYIKEREDWEFVRVYTDEGISATNTKKRDGFKQMVADALAGQIDLIKKENIYTLDSKGELLITIMSSLAQEERRSISENVTWGQRKRMADGKISLPYGQFLGYEKGEGIPSFQLYQTNRKIVNIYPRSVLTSSKMNYTIKICHIWKKHHNIVVGGRILLTGIVSGNIEVQRMAAKNA